MPSPGLSGPRSRRKHGAIGDAAWRWFESQADAARAFSVSKADVSQLINDPPKARWRETFEARPAPPKKRKRPTKRKAGGAPPKKSKWVDGATQRKSGKWYNPVMFPGRDFDDLDEYRAAKKQRAARRAAWSAQCTHRGL